MNPGCTTAPTTTCRGDAHRPHAAQLLQRLDGPTGEVELVLAGEQHVALVDPAVDADLVAPRGVGLDLPGVQ
jgi:hypothetical protein